MTSGTTVFISGAGGYIALHIVDQLLARKYKVIGSVQTEKEGENIIKNFASRYRNGVNFEYVIIPNVAIENCFDEIFQTRKEIEFVIHTVSPVQFNTGKSIEESFINPAVRGTLNVLKAIHQYAPQVTKVVHTSSLGAIRDGTRRSKTEFITEKSWNPITLASAEAIEAQIAGTRLSGLVGYSASKTFAERLAWDFIEKNKPSFTLNAVNPPFVFGPQMFVDVIENGTMNASVELVTELLKTKTPDNDDDPITIANISIDVRDAALFHILALELPILNERLLPIQGKFSQQSILNIMNDNFPQLNGVIAKGHRERTEEIENSIYGFDNSRTRQLTNDVKLIPLEKTVVDTISQLLRVEKLKGLKL